MKRLLAIIILLALIPLFSALAVEESDFIGTWVLTQRESMTECSIVVYQIMANHSVNYIYQKFIDSDSPSESFKAVYTWTIDDDSVAIFNGTDEVKRFYMKNSNTLSSDKRLGYGLYSRVLEIAADYPDASTPEPVPTPEPDPAIAASPSFDLSSLSYSELAALKDQINLAMWNSQEYQEVTVPPGVYEIGKDIPAGHWSVRPLKGCGPDYIIYASASKNQGHDVDLTAGFYIMECICDPLALSFTGEYKTTTDIDMESGYFVRLDCTMIFSPYTGKPDLGFK